MRSAQSVEWGLLLIATSDNEADTRYAETGKQRDAAGFRDRTARRQCRSYYGICLKVLPTWEEPLMVTFASLFITTAGRPKREM